MIGIKIICFSLFSFYISLFSFISFFRASFRIILFCFEEEKQFYDKNR